MSQSLKSSFQKDLEKVSGRELWDNVEFFSSMGELDFHQVHEEKVIAIASNNLAIPVMSKQHVIQAKRLALQAADHSEKWDVDRRDLLVLAHGTSAN